MRNEFKDAPSLAGYTVELCAGSAGLSARLWKEGFATLAVDDARNRHRQKAPCVCLDLSIDSGWQVLYRLVEQGKVFYVHGAPPCGTASKAREKPSPAHLKRKGVYEPQPLRSASSPEGLPGLGAEDQERVNKANDIYSRTAAFFTACHTKGIYWSGENPSSSYLWATKWFTALLQLSGVKFVVFDQCCHGGA